MFSTEDPKRDQALGQGLGSLQKAQALIDEQRASFKEFGKEGNWLYQTEEAGVRETRQTGFMFLVKQAEDAGALDKGMTDVVAKMYPAQTGNIGDVGAKKLDEIQKILRRNAEINLKRSGVQNADAVVGAFTQAAGGGQQQVGVPAAAGLDENERRALATAVSNPATPPRRRAEAIRVLREAGALSR
jgi:hypothetical protein